MGKYLKKFENHAAYEAAESSLILPNVSLCVQENEVHYKPYVHDYSQDYLTFVATESGTFKFSESINYSLDNGTTWTSLLGNINSPTVSAGSKILWKATLTPSYNGIGTFSSTANFTVEGNVMSLLYGDDFADQISLTGKGYAFLRLFSGCTGLTSAENMVLPATTLADTCYSGMFNGCTSLTAAPELPATKLVNQCYRYMFSGCTSLNYIKAMFTTTPSSTYMSDWVNGVSSSGTFVKNSAATWTSSCGVSTYPCNWTVETASS